MHIHWLYRYPRHCCTLCFFVSCHHAFAGVFGRLTAELGNGGMRNGVDNWEMRKVCVYTCSYIFYNYILFYFFFWLSLGTNIWWHGMGLEWCDILRWRSVAGLRRYIFSASLLFHSRVLAIVFDCAESIYYYWAWANLVGLRLQVPFLPRVVSGWCKMFCFVSICGAHSLHVHCMKL